jgi:hypothetical protein
MVERMLASGVAHDIIVLAVRTAEAASADNLRTNPQTIIDHAAERRRASDRERQRIRRQSADNPQISADADSALPYLLKKEDIEVKKEEKKGRAKPDRGHRLPPDWRPKDFHYREAFEQFGFDRKRVDGEAVDIRIWADTNAHRAVARKLDWDLTFSGWMRREAKKFRGSRAGPGQMPRPGSREDRQERTSNAIAKLSDFIANRADDGRASSAPREATSGLLPFAKPP